MFASFLLLSGKLSMRSRHRQPPKSPTSNALDHKDHLLPFFFWHLYVWETFITTFASQEIAGPCFGVSLKHSGEVVGWFFGSSGRPGSPHHLNFYVSLLPKTPHHCVTIVYSSKLLVFLLLGPRLRTPQGRVDRCVYLLLFTKKK